MGMSEPRTVAYQPFYCEENIWQLAQRSDLFTGPCEVVVIVGPPGSGGLDEPRVACWFQRAAAEGEPVLWDYHVVLAERPADGTSVLVWDLDTRLPCPCPASLWVGATFQDPRRVVARFHPGFRVVPSEVYVRDLATDRSHMRDKRGRWRRPPPPWDPPGAPAMNLAAWTSTTPSGPGLLLDRVALEVRWGVDRLAL